MDGIAIHFPTKNALDCRILHTYNLNIFPVVISPDPAEAPHGQVLGPRHPCPLSSSAFPLFRFLRNDHWYRESPLHKNVVRDFHINYVYGQCLQPSCCSVFQDINYRQPSFSSCRPLLRSGLHCKSSQHHPSADSGTY